MFEEKLSSIPLGDKELSPGRRIFEILEDYSPEVQRQALNEAEKLIHQRYDQILYKIREEAESVSKQLEIFKTKE